MAILEPTKLETANYGTVGWNAIYSSNFQKINDYLKKFNWSITTITYSASITVDWNASDVQIVTLTGNATINFSNPRSGGKYVLLVKQDETGGRTITWDSNIVCGLQPKSTANSITAFFFIYDSTNSKYICVQQEAFNADTLDGQHGSYYLDRTNHTGTQPPSTISPQGSGSGLDADTVDGFHASITPSPNVIVPLNAEGILDLSATYVKSNVYTFRRVDLTNATSDYMLQVGEEAIINFTNATNVPLRIATSSGTYYECHLVCSNPGGTSGGTGAPIFLNPNNTTYTDAFVSCSIYRVSAEMGSDYVNHSGFRIGSRFSHSFCTILNYTQIKSVIAIYNAYGTTDTYPGLHITAANWRDTTTPWTSLGTIVFPQATSGYIIVRRLV